MKTNEELIEDLLTKLKKLNYIHTNDIPDIDLYMDQVTTFMDSQMASSKRYPDDKVLTKTMINNYAKNHLLPSPNKKKYSKEHVLMLIFIYYFKSFLSISDIQALLTPLADRYFQKEDGLNVEDLYNEVFGMEKEQVEYLKKDLMEKYQTASQSFAEAEEKDREFLTMFSFICLLSFDVYMKKQLIESIIDSFPSD